MFLVGHLKNKVLMKINLKNTIILSLTVAVIAIEGFALFFNTSSAQVVNKQNPRQLDVTAYIINNENKQIANGEYNVRLAIYRINRTTTDLYPSDTDSKVWEETKKINIENGILESYLGSVVPLPTSLNFSQGQYYLGIRIGTDAEMVPRKRIGAVPLALSSFTANNSQSVQGIVPGNKSGNLLILGKGGKIESKQIPTITKLGNVSVGTWQGDQIDSNYIVKALTGKTYNGLTLISNSNGFSISRGGNTLSLTGDAILNQNLSTSSSPTFNNLYLTGGISTIGSNVTDGYGEFSGICLGNETNCITDWGAAGAISGSGSTDYVTYWTGTSTLGSEQYLNVSRGGTGLAGTTAANGALLIGNGTGYSLATLTAGSNLVITNGAGSISLATSLTPTFTTVNGLTLASATDGFNISGGTTARTLTITGGNVTINGGGNTLTLTGSASLNQSLLTTSSPTFAGITTGNTTINGTLALQDSSATYHTILQGGAQVADVTYTLPTAQAGGSNYVLANDGTGTLSWQAVAGVGGVSGTGTTDYVTYWTGTSTLGSEQYLNVSRGGTGLAGTTAANGALLIGNGTGYSLATLTAGTGVSVTNGAGSITIANTGVTSLAGTTNQVIASASTGAITLSLPQDIATTSSPTFAGLTLSNALTPANGGTGTNTLFTQGSIIFAGASGIYSQNNSNFFWDNTNNRLGLGTTTPQEKLALSSGSNFVTEMTTPTGVTATLGATGTLSGTYYYKVSAYDGVAWTNVSSEVSGTVDGGTTNGTITVAWTAVTGATNYRVWRGTVAATETEYYETTAVSLADDGSLTFTAATPPTVTSAYATKLASASNSWILGGNLGIGDATPDTKLKIVGALCVNSSDADCAGNVAGTIYAINTTVQGADYAEYFFTQDTNLQPGEAVCVDTTQPNAVKRCQSSEDPNVMGIVSSNPSVVGNSGKDKTKNPHYKIIGMLGQIPANVSNENGIINIGDSLTSATTPGYLMKANPGDSTVGIALEKFDQVQGTIQVMIARKNKSLTVEKVEETVTQNIAKMNVKTQVANIVAEAQANLNKQIATQADTLTAIKNYLNIISGGDFANLATPNDTLTKTPITLADLKNQITDLQTDQTSQTKKIADLETQMKDLATQNQAVIDFASALDVKKLIYKDSLGNLDLGQGKLEANGIVAGAFTVKVVNKKSRTIGSNYIAKGEKSYLVKTTAVTRTSVILTNFQSNPDAYSWVEKIKDASGKYSGFKINISQKATQRLHFDWWIIERDESSVSPTISMVTVNTSSDTAEVSWATVNKKTTSQIEYGLDTSYKNKTEKSNQFETFHKMTISNLTAGKIYHFRIIAHDSVGNSTTSIDHTLVIQTAIPIK